MMHIKKLFQSKIAQTFFSPFQGKAAITMYHRVLSERGDPQLFSPNFHLGVDVRQFEAQIQHLAENYHCAKLTDIADQPSDQFRVAVTFDDGHEDNMSLALPILERYQVPATIFISTSLMENPGVVWWYQLEKVTALSSQVVLKGFSNIEKWTTKTSEQKQKCFNDLTDLLKVLPAQEQQKLLLRLLESNGFGSPSQHVHPLNWDQVRELAKNPLITIGAHTQNHPVLRTVPDGLLYEEITQSKFILEDRLDQPITTFAYPFGELAHASRREYQFVKNSGFDLAVTTRFGHVYESMLESNQRWSLPRVPIDPFDGPEKMDWKLSGAGAAVKTAQRLIYEKQNEPNAV